MVQFKYWKQPGPVFFAYDSAIRISPLACESRAYARLDSLNENGTWAARCYGWMRLSDTQFKMLGDVVDTYDLSRWVVVKEYIPTSTHPCHIQMILTNFQIPKKARILPQDVRIENYRGSKIVDLSSTLTAPCPEWSDFLFDYFYKETMFGVFDWFVGEQTCLHGDHSHFFAGPLPLCLSPDVSGPEAGGTGARVCPGSCCT